MPEAPDGSTLPVIERREITMVIEDLKVGTGAVCHPGAKVTIHYHGTLTDGKVFDSTRGQDPVTFPLPDLIQGWQIGIPGMKVGGVRLLTIPYQLAYGERDVPGEDGGVLIPAKSTLVFAIELKGVK